MEPTNPAEKFVEEEVPPILRPLLPPALRRAYAAADETMDRDPYLSTPGGKYQRGDLIMLAASFELMQLVERGDLPFDGNWEFFARPTGKHFVLLTNRSRITTSQVIDPSKKPRRAVYRANYSENNEDFLFPEWNEKVKQDTERRLLHILHGYQKLSFVHIAYPHPEGDEYIYRTPNLIQSPDAGFAPDPSLTPPEGPSDSPTPEAIENLERFLRDSRDA